MTIAQLIDLLIPLKDKDPELLVGLSDCESAWLAEIVTVKICEGNDNWVLLEGREV
jgi:hypothetical protein